MDLDSTSTTKTTRGAVDRDNQTSRRDATRICRWRPLTPIHSPPRDQEARAWIPTNKSQCSTFPFQIIAVPGPPLPSAMPNPPATQHKQRTFRMSGDRDHGWRIRIRQGILKLELFEPEPGIVKRSAGPNGGLRELWPPARRARRRDRRLVGSRSRLPASQPLRACRCGTGDGREAFVHCHRGVFPQVTQSPSGPWECGLAPQLTNPICELDAGPCRLQRLEPIVLLKGSRGGANPTSRQDASDPSSIRAASDSDEAPSCEVLFYTPKCWTSVVRECAVPAPFACSPWMAKNDSEPNRAGGQGGSPFAIFILPNRLPHFTLLRLSTPFLCQRQLTR